MEKRRIKMSNKKIKQSQITPPVNEDSVSREKETKIENQHVKFHQDDEMPGIGYEIFGVPPILNE